MSNGTDIAAEVSAAIAEAATATGSGPLAATILRAGGTNETVYPPTVMDPITYGCTVLLSGYSARDRAGNTGIAAGDVKAMIATAGLDIVPHSGDKISVAGRTFSIVAVDTVQPGGVTLYYKAQARGA